MFSINVLAMVMDGPKRKIFLLRAIVAHIVSAFLILGVIRLRRCGCKS